MAVNLSLRLTGDRFDCCFRSIRDKRLENDYFAWEKLCSVQETEKVEIFEKSGEPPEFYPLQLFNCKGIEAGVNERIFYWDEYLFPISFFQ